MSLNHLTLGFIALTLVLSGCINGTSKTPATNTTNAPTSTTSTSTSMTQTTTTTVASTTSTTMRQALPECIQPPKTGCECIQWVCPTVTTTSTSTTTSTTCVTLPYPDYAPKARNIQVTIKGYRFKPKEIEVFIGDTVIANITSRQGLHRIRETYSNKTVILPPGESHELIFYAEDEGHYLLTCNPFCEEPMEASILVSKPYRKMC